MLFTNKELVFGSHKVLFSLRPTRSQESLLTAVSGQELTQGDEDPATDADLHLGDDLLGLDLWNASITLTKWLSQHQGLIQGKHVVELGAGVGVPGLLAGLAGAARVLLTDYEQHSLHLLHRNIEDNQLHAKVSAKQLDFTQAVDPALGTFDVVLAADVAYLSRYAAPLAAAMCALCAPGGLCLMGHQTRKSVYMDPDALTPAVDTSDEPLDRFLAAMRAQGYASREVAVGEDKAHGGHISVLAFARDAAVLEALGPRMEDASS
mmetsp:Transcript_30641/g.78223  ORF Transcript_30641/g.78223 Transcript_30641/m.78223 type:complete len:264 (-) Transcript_30641:24-815(-)|eukprot:CAMPEP_0202859232 /NCGR_PEP_ID=MMETSP1391-20130828/1442_1 /ASSEMBLY_ACC=CAM_ASM_000867 /TAXON_ID=1034604 /ORGANISM="Chlamydomonas leiostraca, Strain SAG 11-49" /LENGTH=263 /DNA_ID=CAMNT_0049538253 /DNA_START=150 /DNA_END=941 /DNA_ORIENTATION=+